MPSSPPVYFHFLTPVYGFKGRSGLKQFLHKHLRNFGKLVDRLDFIFCNDEFLLKINKKHLNHNFYTDIITFNLASGIAPIVGEIYISVTRVKDNARKYDTRFMEELHRVIFHGLLHLAGFSDKSKRQKEQMRKAENQLLGLYSKASRVRKSA